MGISNPYYLDFGFFLVGLQDNERNSPSVLFVLSFDWAHRTKSIWSNDFLLRPATPSHLTVGLAAMNHEVQSVISCNPQLWIAHWRCIGDSWSGCHGAKPPVASSLGKFCANSAGLDFHQVISHQVCNDWYLIYSFSRLRFSDTSCTYTIYYNLIRTDFGVLWFYTYDVYIYISYHIVLYNII